MTLSFIQPGKVRTAARGASILLVLTAMNILIWASAWVVFAERPELLGTAVLAYLLGLRHAFDPDHIAAIDNVVRKLMQEGKPGRMVGCYFALGHSSIVVLASLAIAGSALSLEAHELGEVNLIRTAASALFLLTIGLTNFFILRSIWRVFQRISRRGESALTEPEDALLPQSAIVAMLRPIFRLISKPRHMFLVGFLLGIGFDTATEIGLFGISGMQATQGMPLWTVLVFPLLFAAGMTLMDTADSILMTNAYGWAFIHPMRKLWYNLTLTFVSVVVALFVGALEALDLLREQLGLDTGLWKIVRELNENLESLGFWIVGIFIVSWICSMIVYRFCQYDKLVLTSRASER
jgi:high-affinity nickel-transport protein